MAEVEIKVLFIYLQGDEFSRFDWMTSNHGNYSLHFIDSTFTFLIRTFSDVQPIPRKVAITWT